MFDLSRRCLANPFCKHSYFLYESFTGVPFPVSRVGTFFMNIQKNIQELLKLYNFFYSSENCLNFQGCFTVQLSRFIPTFSVGFCCAVFVLYRVSEYYIIKCFCICQHFFKSFFTFFQNNLIILKFRPFSTGFRTRHYLLKSRFFP